MDEINLLVARINDRREAEAGVKKPSTMDMRDENNLASLEMMIPGSVEL